MARPVPSERLLRAGQTGMSHWVSFQLNERIPGGPPRGLAFDSLVQYLSRSAEHSAARNSKQTEQPPRRGPPPRVVRAPVTWGEPSAATDVEHVGTEQSSWNQALGDAGDSGKWKPEGALSLSLRARDGGCRVPRGSRPHGGCTVGGGVSWAWGCCRPGVMGEDRLAR